MAKKKVKKAVTSKVSGRKGKKGPAKGSRRMSYPEALKKKVVAAVKKGMTHLEASAAFKVGVHSIPNWLKKHGR